MRPAIGYLWSLDGCLHDNVDYNSSQDRLNCDLVMLGLEQIWIREAFCDPRTYLFFLWSVFLNIPDGGVQAFGSIVVTSFGFDNRRALLLDMPAGIVSVSANLIFCNLSDRFMDRTAFASIALAIPMIGCIMLCTIPFSAAPALLVGYYFISSALAGWGSRNESHLCKHRGLHKKVDCEWSSNSGFCWWKLDWAAVLLCQGGPGVSHGKNSFRCLLWVFDYLPHVDAFAQHLGEQTA